MCWPLLLQRVNWGQVGYREGGGKDLDVILGCVCKIISSSNWRIKSWYKIKLSKIKRREIRRDLPVGFFT